MSVVFSRLVGRVGGESGVVEVFGGGGWLGLLLGGGEIGMVCGVGEVCGVWCCGSVLVGTWMGFWGGKSGWWEL